MIDILLATYNGEKLLKKQMLSLLEQSSSDWALMIHDDGSLDKTLKVVTYYTKKYKEKIVLVNDGLTFNDAKANFSHLLELSRNKYVMLCDQDDTWEKNKIKITFERMLREEAKAPGKPVLVHSDLRVVDSHQDVIAESFFEYQKLPKNIDNLEEALVKNNVTGCTVMLNRAAVDVSMPIPEEAIMHDWWIACKVLQHGGVISFIDRPLVDYRQHGANVIGAHEATLHSYMRKALSLREMYGSYRNVKRQARAMGVEIGPLKFLWIKVRMLLTK